MTSKPVKVFQDEKGRLYIKNKKGKKTYIKTSLTKDAVQKNFIKEWKKSKMKKTRTKRPKKLYRNKPVTKKEIDRAGDTKISSGIPLASEEQARQIAESKKPQGKKDTLYLTVGERNDMAIQEAQKIQDITLKIMEAKNVKALLHDTSRNDTSSQIIPDDKLAQIMTMGNQLNRRLQILENGKVVDITNLSPVAEPKTRPQTVTEMPSAYHLNNKPEFEGFRNWYKKWYRENKKKDASLKPYTKLESSEVYEQYEIYLKTISAKDNRTDLKPTSNQTNATVNLELIRANEESAKKIQELEDQLNRSKSIADSKMAQLLKDRNDERIRQRELSNAPVFDLQTAKQKISDITSFLQAFDQPKMLSNASVNTETPSVNTETPLLRPEASFGVTIGIPTDPSQWMTSRSVAKSTSELDTLSEEELYKKYQQMLRQQSSTSKEKDRQPTTSIEIVKEQKKVKPKRPDGPPPVALSSAQRKSESVSSGASSPNATYDMLRKQQKQSTVMEIPADAKSATWLRSEKNPNRNAMKRLYNENPIYEQKGSLLIKRPFSKVNWPDLVDLEKRAKEEDKSALWGTEPVVAPAKKNIEPDQQQQYEQQSGEQQSGEEQSGQGLSDIYPDDSLYESEIQKLFKEENYQFLPVIAHNEIHKIKLNKKKPTFFVMNLSNRGEEGSHWTSTYINEKGNIYYFDSFGKPPDEETKNQLSDLFEQHGEGTNMLRRLKYNTKGIQDPLASDCGFWAIQFVENMLDGKSFSNSINITEEDLEDEKHHKKEWM